MYNEMTPNELIKTTGMKLETLAEICSVSRAVMLNYSTSRTELPKRTRSLLESIARKVDRMKERARNSQRIR